MGTSTDLLVIIYAICKQNCLTVTKVILIICVIFSGALYAMRNSHIARYAFTTPPLTYYHLPWSLWVFSNNFNASSSFDDSSAMGFGPALVACLWAYSGWQSVNFLAEEVKDFESRISNIVICGVSVVTVLYVLANIAYLCVLSSDDIADSEAVGIDVGRVASGKFLAGFFALGVALSSAGSLHGTILVASRALYAAARSGHVLECFCTLNEAGAPYVAVIAQSLWSIILVLLPGSNFSSLLDYTGPATWFYYALTGSTVFYFRYCEPGRKRPYSAFLYPLPPIVLILLSGYIIVSSFMVEPLYVCLAFVFVGMSFPVRWLSLMYTNRGITSAHKDTQEDSTDDDKYSSADCVTISSPSLIPPGIELSSNF